MTSDKLKIYKEVIEWIDKEQRSFINFKKDDITYCTFYFAEGVFDYSIWFTDNWGATCRHTYKTKKPLDHEEIYAILKKEFTNTYIKQRKERLESIIKQLEKDLALAKDSLTQIENDTKQDLNLLRESLIT